MTSLGQPRPGSMIAPLRYARFRNIWLASLLSNLGLLIQGVGAAWAMTELSSSATLVALVQTATMLPVLLIAIPAGAIADMYDRRTVSIVALLISLTAVSLLFILSLLGEVSAIAILAFCFAIGCGMALFWPAWQSSAGEQVPVESLAAAVALNSISFNIARSFGPALGGVIVAAAGAVASFGASALLYLPMLGVLLASSKTHEPSRLPPERLNRALISGIRYILHSPAIRIVIGRALLLGLLAGSVTALMPLVARDLLNAQASTFGVLLGSYGVGAVAGAFSVARLKLRLGSEGVVRVATIILSAATCTIAFSRSEFLTCVALAVAGGGWMLATTALNIAVQLPVPRWVAGRALATFQASIAGGIAIGSLGWGAVADSTDVQTALLISAAGILASILFGLRWKMEEARSDGASASPDLPDPTVKLAVTHRSGPVVIELEYRVALDDARPFYRIMQQVQLSRQRNGAYAWSIARDLAEPELWVERFHFPTWIDFLRMRNRPTAGERSLEDQASAFQIGGEPVRIRRMLERPFGSVRWKAEARDRGLPATFITGAGGGA
ncbi:MFS transporter [Sphingomonas turrisvirgatae]|uniref:MFS transporter n=2 Tax=Sphingomonadaceae TaxID=41297 RepID=A0A1E3LYC4_9SPHN|nr:MFS transporter [Sphingomonas turrisvirgatae]